MNIKAIVPGFNKLEKISCPKDMYINKNGTVSAPGVCLCLNVIFYSHGIYMR